MAMINRSRGVVMNGSPMPRASATGLPLSFGRNLVYPLNVPQRDLPVLPAARNTHPQHDVTAVREGTG